MKFKLNNDQIVMLNQLKGKMLMTTTSHNVILYCIMNYEITEETEWKERLFGDSKQVKVKYLTGITMHAYHPEGRFVGTLSDNGVESMLLIYNLYHFRQAWVDLQEQLKAFGFQIIEIPETKETKE